MVTEISNQEREVFLKEKRDAMRDEAIKMADAILKIHDGLLKPKHQRNVFNRKVNRRPRNKIKRTAAFAQTQIAIRLGMMRIEMIKAQPIPKFKPGAVGANLAMVPLQGIGDEQIIFSNAKRN